MGVCRDRNEKSKDSSGHDSRGVMGFEESIDDARCVGMRCILAMRVDEIMHMSRLSSLMWLICCQSFDLGYSS